MYGIFWTTFFPWFDWENGIAFDNVDDIEMYSMFNDYKF